MKTLFRWSLGVLVAVVLAGCATPESRIRKNPEIFAAFPPEVQANVRQGKIEIGYTTDMVTIALGQSDRQYKRKTAAGESEVWAYTDNYVTTERQLVSGPFRYRDSSGNYHTTYDNAWVDVQQRREYERLRIEFENGKVKAIEQLEHGR